jgi:hypothetical protein
MAGRRRFYRKGEINGKLKRPQTSTVRRAVCFRGNFRPSRPAAAGEIRRTDGGATGTHLVVAARVTDAKPAVLWRSHTADGSAEAEILVVGRRWECRYYRDGEVEQVTLHDDAPDAHAAAVRWLAQFKDADTERR